MSEIVTPAGAEIGGIVPYYGAKRDPVLLQTIITEFGQKTPPGYYESCGGSLAVVLGKQRSPMEHVTDLYGDAINLARVLASDYCADLYDRVNRTLVHSDIFEEAKEKLGLGHDAPDALVAPGVGVDQVEPAHIERAYWFLVASWQGINGVTGTHRGNVNLARRFTVGGGHGGTRWASVCRSIPWWHERLKGVLFDRMSCFDFAPRLADDGTWLIYSDPPYYAKGDTYIHDWTPEQHEEWARILRAKNATRIVVSYYDHPRIRELYEGWTVVDCSKTKNMVSVGRRDGENKKVAPEILLINGPSYSGGRKGLWA